MKTLIINIFALFLILSLPSKLFSQEIEIDLTFTCDTVIFPFENIETISELTMEGEIRLDEDTSLVRVILEDESGIRYMLFEGYPLICPNSVFSVESHCDETCFLDQVNPYSIIIQIIDGSLNLKSLYYSTDPKENSVEERYKAKRAMDAEKIEFMNQIIPSFNMNWTAGDNSMVARYYDEKRHIFDDGYNLAGYDYYKEGVFEFVGQFNFPKVDPNFVKHFDWRDRHGANKSTSPYWDGKFDGTGWLTPAKEQDTCGACWAFASAGVTEAMVNLYHALPLDYDLSEQDILCNANEYGCGGSWVHYDGFLYIKNSGVISEECYPYDTILFDQSCDLLEPCQNPNSVIKIFDTSAKEN